MRITILGAGEVGTHLARALTSDGHEVALIEADGERVRYVRDALDIEVIQGHGGDVEILHDAMVEQCDLFCAVTSNDELNMLASLLAKKLGAKQTAVRVAGLSHITARRFFYRRTLEFDLTISPEEMVASAISRQVRDQDFLSIEELADGKLQLQKVELTGRFDASGKKIKDIKLPKQSLITALIRSTSILIPTGDDEVHVGDQVLLMAETKTMERVHKLLGAKLKLPRRVVIVGGGRAGQVAAQTLSQLKIKVKLLDRSLERCEKLAQTMPQIEIQHADGTNLAHLLEESIDKVELFCALTENDEANIISCQLAREIGVEETVALVWKRDYKDLYSKLGVASVISPRKLVAEHILRFVASGGSTRVTPIEEGRAEVLELDIPEKSPLMGVELKDIKFPRGALVGAIVRGEEVIVPTGTDTIMKDDMLVVFALTQARRAVEALLA